MSSDPAAPVALSFGDAYDRLQQVATELGADQTMAPDRLIALLREGKGLERALRDHLERVEQEVRAIEDGDGAVAFRIADGSGGGTGLAAGSGGDPGGTGTAGAAGFATSAPAGSAAPSTPPATADPPSAPRPAAPAPDPSPSARRPAAPAPDPSPSAPRPAAPAPDPSPSSPPTLGFPAADDDIPF